MYTHTHTYVIIKIFINNDKEIVKRKNLVFVCRRKKEKKLVTHLLNVAVVRK